MADNTASNDPSVVDRAKDAAAWVMKLKPVRAFQNFNDNRGNLLASGLSYLSIFALFAGIWVGFSIAGFIINGNPELQAELFRMLNQTAPGLIGENGAIKPSALTETTALSWTGAIALVGLVGTGLAWLDGMRNSIRTIFELPKPTTNGVILKLTDVAFAIGFAVVLVLSAAISIFSTAALDFVFNLVGLGDAGFWVDVAGRVVGAVIMLALNTAVLIALLRVLARVKIPGKYLVRGSLLGGVGLAILQLLGSALLGGASRNPLLAGFAVIIGLLIWFNLISRVILLTASWIAVGLEDNDIAVQQLTPEQIAERRMRARLTVARADLEAAQNDVAQSKGFRKRRAKRDVREAQRRLRDLIEAEGFDEGEAAPTDSTVVKGIRADRQ